MFCPAILWLHRYHVYDMQRWKLCFVDGVFNVHFLSSWDLWCGKYCSHMKNHSPLYLFFPMAEVNRDYSGLISCKLGQGHVSSLFGGEIQQLDRIDRVHRVSSYRERLFLHLYPDTIQLKSPRINSFRGGCIGYSMCGHTARRRGMTTAPPCLGWLMALVVSRRLP